MNKFKKILLIKKGKKWYIGEFVWAFETELL